MKNKFNITEEEKNRIRNLHNNHPIIKEDTQGVEGTPNEIIQGCLMSTALQAGFDPKYDVPFSCVQSIFEPSEKYLSKCGEALMDIILGDDNVRGEELFNFIRKHGATMIKCVEAKGVNITDEIIDGLDGVDLRAML